MFESASDSGVEFTHGGEFEQHGGIMVEKLLEKVMLGMASAGFAIYEPGSSTGPTGVTKPGMEFLVLLEGTLVAEVDGRDYEMGPGDVIHFPTTLAHRGSNHGSVTARAFYINYSG